MSWMKCYVCDLPCDTDDDPEGWREIGDMKRNTMDIYLCWDCRDQFDEEQERRWEEAR